MTHLRPRHMIYFIMIQRVMLSTGSHTKPEHSLSPTNRWTIGENKSNDGRIIENLLQPSGEQLGRIASGDTIHYK